MIVHCPSDALAAFGRGGGPALPDRLDAVLVPRVRPEHACMIVVPLGGGNADVAEHQRHVAGPLQRAGRDGGRGTGAG